MKSRLLIAVLLLPLGAGPAFAGWKALAPLEQARAGIGAAALNGTVFVAGGRGLTSASGVFESFDPQSGAWSPQPSLPVPLSDMGMAAAEGRLYLAGGFIAPGKPTAGLLMFDPAQNKWSRGPDMPAPRGAHVLLAVGGKLYVIGGMGPDPGRVFIFDIASGQWQTGKAPLPHPRAQLAAVVRGKLLYAIGGNEPGGKASAAVDVFDTTTDTWRSAPALPMPRAGLTAAVIGDTIHVTGGQRLQPLKTFGDHLVLAGGATQWETRASLPTPRHGAGSVSLNGAWYVVGGGKGAGFFTNFTAADTVEMWRD